MKCLTLKQPYAGLVVAGLKTIETRMYRTKHRGPLAIHASQTLDRRAEVRIQQEGHKLPAVCFIRGQVIGVVNVVDVRDMTPMDAPAAYCETSPGRRAWLLKGARIIESFEARGWPGMFEISVDDIKL